MLIKDNFIGFSKSVEYLPKDFDEFNSKYRLRQLFLSLSNNILKSYCYFSKYEQRFLANFTLNKAFEYKIKNMLPISYIKNRSFSKSFKLCINSTKIINNYLKKEQNSQFLVATSSLLPVARLISICYVKKSFELLIDKNLLFHEFVLQRVKNLHGRKNVIDFGDSIILNTKSSNKIKIYTSWKDIEMKNLNIKNELKNAIKSIKDENFQQVYLAFPKNEEFTKHISVYVDELKNFEYRIKAIPYSFRSIIK